MKSTKLKIIVFFLVTVFLTGLSCAQSSSPTVTPSVESVSTATVVIPTEPHSLVPKGYMEDCKSIFPTIYTQQADFQGIIPGVTTRQQLTDQFGMPDKSDTINEGHEYIYFDPLTENANHVFIVQNLVSSLNIESNNNTWLPLKQILERYGCPDLIIATVSDSDEPSSTTLVYDRTDLAYLRAGLWVGFDHYPVRYSDSPYVMTYDKPKALDSYLEELSFYLTKKFSLIVSFADAVK